MRDSSKSFAYRDFVVVVALEGYRVFGNASIVVPRVWLPQFECLSAGVALVVVAFPRGATIPSTAIRTSS
eukprot:4519970-Pyramimonas_sp.AAC.1